MSAVLRRNMATREEFDPANALHIESLKSFMHTGAWGKVQFFAELPHVAVPMTVLMKFVHHTLKVAPELATDRQVRVADMPSFSVSTPKQTPASIDFSRILHKL